MPNDFMPFYCPALPNTWRNLWIFLEARLFIDLLKIGTNSVDAKRLKDYKAPKSASNTTLNDFASVLYEVLKDRGYDRYEILLYIF